MSARIRDEAGSAVVSAVVLLSVMIALGLATLAMTDTQSRQSSVERVREASFTVSEAALNSAIDRFSGSWPLQPSAAFPTVCNPTTGTLPKCPDPVALTASVSSADEANAACGGANAQWKTFVRDNGGGATTYYKTSVVTAQPTYDANGDGLMWVRAEGSARCKQRTLVTLVRANVVTLAFPRVTIGANWFWTANQGRKVIVDTLGTYAQPPSIRPDKSTAKPAPVQVRCTPPFPSPCLKIESNKGQVSGSTPQQSAPMQSPALNDTQLAQAKARAIALNSYYPTGSCPPSIPGPLVFVDDMTTCPSYGGGNDKNNPGVLIIGRGTLSLGGNRTFYGLVYARNLQGTSGAVVQTSGTALIQGSVVVDGLGGVVAGSSSSSVVFDPRVTDLMTGLGEAHRVPGSWRELSPQE
jgi:Tfp pilus assembly protein PilX